jgi:hypothetical protein
METCNKMEFERLETYWDILKAIKLLHGRATYKEIAKQMGHTGRGRSPSTIQRHFTNMKKRKITRNPILIQKPYRESQTNVYFCRKPQRKEVTKTYKQLCSDSRINYVLYLAGDIDYFVTSREDLDLKDYDIEIIEKNKLYDPIFTFPLKGSWKIPSDVLYEKSLTLKIEKGRLDRKVYDDLQWDETDWRIYESMKFNVRKPFSIVSEEIKISQKTVKSHFYKKIIPASLIAYYFFPEGYDFYKQTFIQIYTAFERGLVNAFRNLATTTYIYPLEDRIVLNCFHEDENFFMGIIKGFEENEIIEKYTYAIPIKPSAEF